MADNPEYLKEYISEIHLENNADLSMQTLPDIQSSFLARADSSQSIYQESLYPVL